MTSQNFIEVEHVRTWHLSSSLAYLNSLIWMFFFKFCLVNPCCLWRPCSMDLFNWLPCVPLGFFRSREYCFCSYFLLKSSNCFPDQTPIFGRSFIFCTFFFNDASLIFRLHDVTLPTSLTLSWPAKTVKNLNKSGVEFLVLVLPSSNSLIWMLFSNFV